MRTAGVPYNMRVGGANIEQMQIRVPIDRTTTRFVLAERVVGHEAAE